MSVRPYINLGLLSDKCILTFPYRSLLALGRVRVMYWTFLGPQCLRMDTDLFVSLSVWLMRSWDLASLRNSWATIVKHVASASIQSSGVLWVLICWWSFECGCVTKLHISYTCLLSPSDHKRLANFAVLVGGNPDWRYNQHCYSRLPPVPQGATIEHLCENPRLGNLVSINKTAEVGGDRSFWMLMLHEVQVLSYKTGMITLDK